MLSSTALTIPHLFALFPPLWTALLLAMHGFEALRRRWPGQIRLPLDDDDEKPPQKPLFAVFIEDEDVLAAQRSDTSPANAVEAVEADGEAAPPPPSSLVVFIPLVEALAWSIVLVGHLWERKSTLSDYAIAAGHFGSWLFASISQLRRRSATAPLSLLSLYVVLLIDAGFSLVQQTRSARPEGPISLATLSRFPDLLLILVLTGEVLQTPLNAPLVIADHESKRPRSPEDSNSVAGAFTYSWMNGIMAKALSRPLSSADVWALALNNRAEVLYSRFSSLRSKTLTRRLLRASARDIAIDASLKLVASTSEYLRPYFIQKILENLTLAYHSCPSSSPSSGSSQDGSRPWTPREKAYLFAFLAFLSMLSKTLAQQRHFHHARRIGMRLRSELTSAVFAKALRRREAAGGTEREKKGAEACEGEGQGDKEEEEESASVGKVVSMISEDVNRVLRMGCDSHLIYGSPLEIALGLAFLFNLMGWSALVGFLVLAISAPLNYYLGKVAVNVARSRSTARDDRQNALQELVSHIHSIKLLGWSDAWIERVTTKRGTELSWAIQDWTIRWLTTALWAIISLAVPLASFYAYTKLAGQELTVAIAFTALSLFSLIRGPLNQIPGFGIRILQLQVSIARLEFFFREDEIASHATPVERKASTRLALNKVTLRYAGRKGAALSQVDVVFPEGMLTVISGPTGSGKSSVLLGLLGELEVVDGSVELPPLVSYAAQHPWLESLSVRDNILFGYRFNEKRYRAVLRDCALEPDVAMLAEEDQTFVGERGVSLSGGQKARLALARAIYAPTRHIILDDVFSAVDSHTARHLLDRLFDPANGDSLLKGRTCVLVTHHVDLLLPFAAYHVELEAGRVRRQGAVVRVAEAEEKAEEELGRMEDEQDGVEEIAKTDVTPASGEAGRVEGWISGEVKGAMYQTYLSSSGGYLLWSLIAVFLLARPAFSFAEQFWLRKWGEAADDGGDVDSSYFLLGYALIGSLTALDTLLATVFIYVTSLRGSRALFHKLLVRVVSSPLRWFDVVPLGSIANRMTNDVATVDDALATNFTEFAGNIVSVVASLAVVSIVLPPALASSVVFAIIYAYLFRRYLTVSRDVNRIAATTASPLFSSFAEALRGVTTIRAFGKEVDYQRRLFDVLDETLAFWYLGATLDVWLSIRVQLLSAFCLLVTATFATYTNISPGFAGIAITSSQSVLLAVDNVSQAYGRLVLSLNSLERITEYLELPQEPEGTVPPANWPSATEGETLIKVKGLVIRYSPELPPVLHGVSFEIKAGERIGVVGRTGSGKSTLATSLLRFADPSTGSIHIGGLDICHLSLTHLRQRLTLVPQEASLFAGSLRSNLDPLNEHDDAELNAVLQRIHLDDAFSTTTKVTLDSTISAGGSNWSAGQRQLLALGRALLRNSKVVILDESSASLDHDLDARIQQVLRDELPKDAVVITIAHRLKTILDSDRLLVLDGGRIVELDTPQALLAKEDGVFRRMWEKSGSGE